MRGRSTVLSSGQISLCVAEGLNVRAVDDRLTESRSLSTKAGTYDLIYLAPAF